MAIRLEITYVSGRVERKILTPKEAKIYEQKLRKVPTVISIKKEEVK